MRACISPDKQTSRKVEQSRGQGERTDREGRHSREQRQSKDRDHTLQELGYRHKARGYTRLGTIGQLRITKQYVNSSNCLCILLHY